MDRGTLYTEIGEIVSGGKPGREKKDEIIVYVPMGMGTEDMSTAQKVYLNAIALGKGSKLTICKA